jgi:hypothetical protein
MGKQNYHLYKHQYRGSMIKGVLYAKGGEQSEASAAWQPQQLIRAAIRANRSEITVESVARGGERSDDSAA